MPAARWSFTRRSDGDFHVGGEPAALARRRAAVTRGAWTWLHQVHGADVVMVDEPGQHAGAEADAAVSARVGTALAVHTADCAPVLLRDPEAVVIGAAHAGWRGLTAGVVERTVDAMTRLGATAVEATIGPHIRARCYEFGADDLEQVAARYGDAVRATTGWGTPALDVGAGVRAALDGCDVVTSVEDVGGCTACEPTHYYSHRARGDEGRHAAVIWIEP